MSRLSMEEMMMEMVERLYDDDESGNLDTEKTKNLIDRTHAIVEVADTLTKMSNSKMNMIKMQVEMGIEINSKEERGFRYITDKTGEKR